ncbi:hypothetical protein D3C72_1614830 [compost metagenome]
MLVICFFLASQLPISGRASWPSANGSSSCSATPVSARPSGMLPVPEALITRPISSGVSAMPIRPEMVALKMAPGTLPRAIDVMATDEDTVDGSTHRKNTPSSRSAGSLSRSANISTTPTTGNTT